MLPKFDLKLETEPCVLLKNGKIVVNVVATYTFGMPVAGRAVVVAKKKTEYIWGSSVAVKRTIDIEDGKGTLVFDILGDFEMTSSGNVIIEAEFKETLTDKVQKVSASVKICDTKNTHRMSIILDSNVYKWRQMIGQTFRKTPGLPLEVIVKVRNFDDTPTIDAVNPVEVVISFKCNGDLQKTTYHKILDQFGEAKLHIDVPENSKKVYIQVLFEI